MAEVVATMGPVLGEVGAEAVLPTQVCLDSCKERVWDIPQDHLILAVAFQAFPQDMVDNLL